MAYKEYRWGIQTKFPLALGLLVLMSLSSFGLFSYLVTKQTLEKQMGKNLIYHAEVIAGMLKAEVLVDWLPEIANTNNFFYYNTLKEKLASVNTGEADLDNIILIGPENRVIADAEGKLPIGQELANLKADQIELKMAWGGKSEASLMFPGRDGRPHKSAYAPISTKDNRVVAVVRVEGSARFLDTINRVAFVLLGIALFITAFAAILGILVARTVVVPIKQLVEASQSIASGNLDTEVKVKSRDEIGFFARTFNQMAKNLKKLYEEVAAQGRQIAELSASVAHEVRSPISAIKGFTELLADELDEDDPRREYIDDIQEEINILNSKVTDFIHFARPLEIESNPLDITEILESAMASMEKEALDKNVNVKYRFDDNLPIIMGDYEQLRGLFINLIRNAVQAIEDEGNLTISANYINGNPRSTIKSSRLIEIIIRDSGCGMNNNEIEKAFDPFFTRKVNGTGLGLSICKKIIEAHKGEIRLESIPTVGTTVRVFLPFTPQKETQIT